MGRIQLDRGSVTRGTKRESTTMNTYKVTIGTLHGGICGNEFQSSGETRIIRAKTRAGAAGAALQTRAALTSEHDVEDVLAIDREVNAMPEGADGNARAAHVVEL